jgi:hypothetical protein
MIEFAVCGIGVWGPGFSSWDELQSGLRGGTWVETAALQPDLIPARERRRAPRFVKMAVEVMGQACAVAQFDPSSLVNVFATAMSDMDTTDYMCRILAESPRLVSPTRFHNSVTNAPSGYWSIATKSHSSANAVCAYQYSAPMALLEAASQLVAEQQPVLLCVQDESSPQALRHVSAAVETLAIAMLIAQPGVCPHELMHCRLNLLAGEAGWPQLPQALQGQLAGNPSARLLPLALAAAASEPVSMEMPVSPGMRLQLQIQPK